MKIVKKTVNEAVIDFDKFKKDQEVEVEGEADLNQSKEEVADDVQANIEAAGETISDDAAEEVAEVAKEVGSEIGVDTLQFTGEGMPLAMETKFTEVLDEALAYALKNKGKKSAENFNILVSGLPGSSKTAQFYNWARNKVIPGKEGEDPKNLSEADKVHVTYVDAKNDELKAYINGYVIQNPDNPREIVQGVSQNLSDLDRPNSILFLDELNRQTKDTIRGSLLTLVNEHTIQGIGENGQPGGRRKLKNLLFTVVAINPDWSDTGVTYLGTAENTRYAAQLTDFDSDPETTKQFLTANYLGDAKEEIQQGDKADKSVVESDVRSWDLGTYIVSHESFNYDGSIKNIDQLSDEEYDAADKARRTKWGKIISSRKVPLVQRVFTTYISISDGDPDKFLKILKTANLSNDTRNMLVNIVNDYKSDRAGETIEQLCERAGIIWPWGEDKQKTADSEEETTQNSENSGENTEAEAEAEDDSDFFQNHPEDEEEQKITGIPQGKVGAARKVAGSWAEFADKQKNN